MCDVWDTHLEPARSWPIPRPSTTKNHHETARSQGRRRRRHRHARPLARADDDRRLRGRQGRLRREAADARPGRGPAVIDAQNQYHADRAGRHAAAQHAAVSKGVRDRRSRASWARSTKSTSPGTATSRAGPARAVNIDPTTVDWKRFWATPDQPFDEYRFRNWRWFWDFGGGILTDLMVHYIDVAHWFLDLDHPQPPPRSATSSRPPVKTFCRCLRCSRYYTEIVVQPRRQPLGAVPLQLVEILAPDGSRSRGCTYRPPDARCRGPTGADLATADIAAPRHRRPCAGRATKSSAGAFCGTAGFIDIAVQLISLSAKRPVAPGLRAAPALRLPAGFSSIAPLAQLSPFCGFSGRLPDAARLDQLVGGDMKRLPPLSNRAR